MEAGKLNRRITLQQEQLPTKDSEGLTTSSWATFATVWAAIEPLKGREYFQAAAVSAENTVRMKIRYRPGVTAALRVLYGNRVFNIRAALDIDEKHREIELMCEEVADGS